MFVIHQALAECLLGARLMQMLSVGVGLSILIPADCSEVYLEVRGHCEVFVSYGHSCAGQTGQPEEASRDLVLLA